MRNRAGFTLLELMIVVAVLTVVLGLLYGLAMNAQRVAASQDARILGQDQVRTGMRWMARELRQATTGSVSSNTLPSRTLSYRCADDIDGNGTAVNVGSYLETTPLRTIGRDTTDANKDGRTTDQLVMIEGQRVTVIANGIMPDEDANNNNALDGGEDANFNGVLDRGVLFQHLGGGILVTLQSVHRAGPQDQPQLSTMREVIVPRN